VKVLRWLTAILIRERKTLLNGLEEVA